MPTFTQAEIDAFRQAILDRKGADAVSYGDETVHFESLEAARAHLAYMERNLVTSTTPRTRYAVTSKGV